MKLQELLQGSAEWLAYRAQHFNASDAPAMMGVSPYKSRAELLREMHTGVAPEIDPMTQIKFAKGHRFEALARPLGEEFIGAELYPVTGSEGRLSASFDGLRMDETEGFEHKHLNAPLKAAFAAMAELGECKHDAPCRLLPLHYRVQMEQQLLVSGAYRILFMASDWTDDDELIEEHHCWYYPDNELSNQIIAGWAQFARDLAEYSLPAPEPAQPIGNAPQTLPALHIEVTGQVTASNLTEFKQTALAAIRSVNRTLTTDQDFADADKAIKWCGDVESRLAAAKEHALSQTASIDELFKALDDIAAESKRVRLDLDKLVSKRKVEVKEEAVSRARKALDAHIATLNAEIAPVRLPAVQADFAGAIKGKRSITSMQDALDDLLAAAKIDADAKSRAIRVNLGFFQAQAAGYEFLFADLGQLVYKAADDFALQVRGRIDAHKLAESEKARKAAEEAERKRLADAAEDARVAALAEQRRQDAAAESVRIAAQAPAAPAVAPPVTPAQTATRILAASLPDVRREEPATLKLGTICDRLGFAMTSAFVAERLGISAAKTEGAAKLYRESDFARICRALQVHVARVAEVVPA